MCTSVLVLCLFIVSVFGCDEKQAKIRFYSNSMDNYEELCIEEAEKIFSTSWYDPKRTTVMFCHGFTGHPKGPAITATVTTLLSLGHYNVALVNWEKLAAMALPGLINSYTNWAVPNSIQVAMDLSDALLRMSAAGLDMNNTHLVGHSLGAHICGIAGTKMLEKGVQLPCLTALDAAIGFDNNPAFLRLSPTSARFVSVIHSNPNKYGSNKNLGFVDFWPNFKLTPRWVQPGCPKKAQRFTDEEFCSHNRAWQFFVEAISRRGTMLGSHAKNFRTWSKYNKEQRRKTVLELGVCDFNAVPGNYYFTTNAEEPYGLGEKGL